MFLRALLFVSTLATFGCSHHARPPASAHTDGPVVVYGASWCAHTAEARTYLTNHHVAMVFRDVERDPDAMDTMYRRLQEAGVAYGGIPVIDVHGRVLVGYDEPSLSQALDE